jgi:hypothetical protein
MGTVYVAHDPLLGRMVAIKVFAGDLDVPDARERFSREARAAAALNHPGIVTVYDFGEFDAQPYIVMEYVTGETMANVIRRKVAVSLADKLRWMEELCAGANYAHHMSVVHRDIKPANLMIDRSGRLKILDFGIARLLGIASNTQMMIGTPGYMAPEQITGDTVDHRSDQFSIGVVFYELLAYKEPFPGDTLPAITHKILSEEPVALDQLVPDVPPELISIVSQALAKSSAGRFADADAMRRAIARVRRRFDIDDRSSTTLPVPGRDTAAPPTGGSRGTGSAHRRTSNAVGVAELTPPPDPRRTDREALARRRAQQLEAAMVLSRTLFDQQQLEGALDACQQALTLDESHAEALELEHQIQTAIRVRDGIALGDAVTTAVDTSGLGPGPAASRIAESEAVTRFDEQPFALGGPPSGQQELKPTNPSAPLSGVGERTVLRVPVASVEATIVAPPRRTPAPTPPQVPPPASVPPVAAKPEPSAKVPEPPAKPSPAAKKVPVPVKKSDKPAVLKQLTGSISSALQSLGPAVDAAVRGARGGVAGAQKGAQKGKQTALWAGVAVGVLALVGVAVYVMTRGPEPTGIAVIDAVPWGTITSIVDEDGDQYPIPSPASTPVSVALPAGTYVVTLTGPEPGANSQQVSVRVDVGGTNIVPITRFRSVTAEEYFEQYLRPVETVAAPAATPEAPTTPPPTGVAQ